MLHRCLHPQPLRMRLHRESRTEHAFGHVGNDAGARRIGGVPPDSDMPHRADLPAKRDVVPHDRGAGDACLRHRKAVRAQLAVMADMDEIVDLRAMSDDGRPHRRTVNAHMGADLHVILQDHIADLRHLRMHTVRRRKAETIRTKHGRRMDHAAFSDVAILPYRRAGINHRVFLDLRILTDIGVRIDRHMVPDHRMVIHHRKGHDLHMLPDGDILPDMRLGTDTFRNFQPRGENIQQLRKGNPRLLHPDGGQRKILDIFRQHDCGCLAFPCRLNMRLHRENQAARHSALNIVQRRDLDRRIAIDIAAHIVRQFLQCLFHAILPSSLQLLENFVRNIHAALHDQRLHLRTFHHDIQILVLHHIGYRSISLLLKLRQICLIEACKLLLKLHLRFLEILVRRIFLLLEILIRLLEDLFHLLLPVLHDGLQLRSLRQTFIVHIADLDLAAPAR